MLNYGAAAQGFFTYNVDDPANALLTEEQKSWATAAVECSGEDYNPTLNYKGTSLDLEDKILMNFYFQKNGVTAAMVETMYAEVSFVGYLGNEEHHTMAVTMNNTGVLVKVDKTVLGDSFEPVTVKVYNADGTLFGECTDSVESYISRVTARELYTCIAKFAYSGREYMLNKK